jgi:hypothetical protein
MKYVEYATSCYRVIYPAQVMSNSLVTVGHSVAFCNIYTRIYVYIYIYISYILGSTMWELMVQGIHKRMVLFQTLIKKIYTRHTRIIPFFNRARNSRCTVITDLDTSKRSTQKAFSCCDAILITVPAAPQ